MTQQQMSDGDDDRLPAPPHARTAPLAAPSSSRGLAYISMSENRKNVRSSILPILLRFETLIAALTHIMQACERPTCGQAITSDMPYRNPQSHYQSAAGI